MRFETMLAPVILSAFISACPSSTPSIDGGDARADTTDVTPDTGGCSEVDGIHSIYPGPIYVSVGGTQTEALRLQRDRSGCAADYSVTIDSPIAMAPAMIHLDVGQSYVEFTVTGVSAGQTQLHVIQVNPVPGNPMALMTGSATTALNVMASAVPSCPGGTSATGTLMPGTSVTGTVGTPLAAASIRVPATATTSPAVAVTLSCAPDQLPSGYVALGPAIRFDPGYQTLPREMPTTIPVNASLIPGMYELQTEIAYTGPGVLAPRIVSMANTRLTLDGSALYFEAPRLGTYQAVIRQGIGTHTVTKHFTWHSIMGVSMGGLGASMIGMRNHSQFDSIVTLGGPADWTWFGNYFRSEQMGGFCTAAQRAAGTMDCSMATNDRTPPPDDLWTIPQNFEYLYYPDGRMNQGGTYDRGSYMEIYRDLVHMFGNPLLQSDPAGGILPLGVPPSMLTMSDADRCMAANVVTLNHYCDADYNADGSLPVITFCDGYNVPGHSGEFTPGQGDYPFDMALAVDINGNGIRDPGEPVIRHMAEPFDDYGTDQTPDALEAGYDSVMNPDPVGDDYDRQYNPGGTEGNHTHDEGEHFDDVGLDGIANSTAAGCMYDQGEGNGVWDTPIGVQSFLSHNAAGLYAALPQAEAHRLNLWTDGGTRDFFQLNESGFHYAGAVSEQNESLGTFNNFSPLVARVPFDPNSDTPAPPAYPEFTFTDVDYSHLPSHSMLRYGFWDATAAEVIAGDGSHVGTNQQATNRFYASFWFAQSHWPEGDRTLVAANNAPDDAGMCAHGNVCSFEFTSTHAGRTGPVSMYLPAGYYDPANATETYPVLFVLHGYGMQPSDLLPTGILIASYGSNGNYASWQRPSKFIMVFPDGRCRAGDGCVNGTFYVDSPIPGNAQMETFFMDVKAWVDANFRVRPESDVQVIE